MSIVAKIENGTLILTKEAARQKLEDEKFQHLPTGWTIPSEIYMRIVETLANSSGMDVNSSSFWKRAGEAAQDYLNLEARRLALAVEAGAKSDVHLPAHQTKPRAVTQFPINGTEWVADFARAMPMKTAKKEAKFLARPGKTARVVRKDTNPFEKVLQAGLAYAKIIALIPKGALDHDKAYVGVMKNSESIPGLKPATADWATWFRVDHIADVHKKNVFLANNGDNTIFFAEKDAKNPVDEVCAITMPMAQGFAAEAKCVIDLRFDGPYNHNSERASEPAAIRLV